MLFLPHIANYSIIGLHLTSIRRHLYCALDCGDEGGGGRRAKRGKTLEAVASLGAEDALDAQLGGYFVVVDRVTDHHYPCRRIGGGDLRLEHARKGKLARTVEVVGAAHEVEVVRNAESGDCRLQEILPEGGENRLTRPATARELKRRDRVGIERGGRALGVIGGDSARSSFRRSYG